MSDSAVIFAVTLCKAENCESVAACIYENKIREDFLQFEPLRNVTGRGLAESLLV
jgi:hypothetical protein